MVPEPTVLRRAVRIARAHAVDTVWFGAAAPLALLGPRLRARPTSRGCSRAATATRSGGRCCPAPGRRCAASARDTDVVTTVSRYTRGRVAAAFGPTAALEPLPPGIDADRFRPDAGRPRRGAPPARPRRRARRHLRLPARGAQGPGHADPRAAGDPGAGARHAARCWWVAGPTRDGYAPWPRPTASRTRSCSQARSPTPTWPPTTRRGTSSPCRAAPAGGGWTSRGWASRCLEAAASGLPVVAGRSGGAPETVQEGRTGHVVDGRDLPALVEALVGLLADPARAAAMGAAGRAWMRAEWGWAARAARLSALLDGDRSRAGSGGLFAARVDARDVVGVLLDDDRPLDLHRRRHLAARPR